ncbi:DUF4926 domain-containing protein [Imperialibacter sp. EC-SDR9]|uniref:DUF4926 domain-containing protein n=2 Tax=Imperialibacter TaxID=1649461 RepID=UPI00125944F0|nr:hypothetical protein IMPERIA89_190016 [Imperialibacter sp. 89]CAD5275474.1 hypothetical protein IMPERIA75_410051 [Imperialibacter sp. 75]VVT19783.1 hypothetical protein IMPR6_290051 [Imperialibacter sp. EC-SDR9]
MYKKRVKGRSVGGQTREKTCGMQSDIGTVVMIHDNGKGYEVEFFTLKGKTRSVETLKASQVRSVKSNEVAHSRKIA